jgi:hypothetical protein
MTATIVMAAGNMLFLLMSRPPLFDLRNSLVWIIVKREHFSRTIARMRCRALFVLSALAALLGALAVLPIRSVR